MAQEDKIEEELVSAMKKVLSIPRPEIKRQILLRCLANTARLLNLEITIVPIEQPKKEKPNA